MSSTPIYSLRVNEVFQSLETSMQGLSTAEAESRRALYRENILSEQARPPMWRKYAAQATHPFVVVMIIAGLITLWQREFALSVVILLVAVVNAGFSFWREYQAERAVEKLKHLLPTYAHVIRDGKDVHLPAAEIVPGDVLILAEGDNIPADARVVEEYGLRVNNSSLTGESLAARENSGCFSSDRRQRTRTPKPDLCRNFGRIWNRKSGRLRHRHVDLIWTHRSTNANRSRSTFPVSTGTPSPQSQPFLCCHWYRRVCLIDQFLRTDSKATYQRQSDIIGIRNHRRHHP